VFKASPSYPSLPHPPFGHLLLKEKEKEMKFIREVRLFLIIIL
jgi:hypothetical protein